MQTQKKAMQGVFQLVAAALLVALALVIPMCMPKVVIPPMSFTLASHVPVFLALFINPVVSIGVALASAVGFFFTTVPVIALRALLGHLAVAIVGSLILKAKSDVLMRLPSAILFSLVLALVHAAGEVVAVSIFFFSGNMTDGWYAGGYLWSVALLVGVGTVVHSMVDFALSGIVWKAVHRLLPLRLAAQV